ncbi:MAG: DUF4249 family protein [bacterium]
MRVWAPAVGRVVLAACAALAIFGGCAANRDTSELFDTSAVGTLVVDAVLIVDKPMPNLFVRTILAPDVPYDATVAGVRGAQVTIKTTSGSYRYQEESLGSARVGLYRPPGAPLVAPNTTYDLEVVTLDGRRVTATTTTPDRFNVSDWVLLDEESLELIRDFATFEQLGDSVYYAPQNQVVYLDGLLEARFAPGPNLKRYHVGLSSLDLDSDYVIEGDFLEDEDFEDFDREGSSPALEASGGFVRLPWFAIYFAGRHKIRVYAIDQNWFDLARSSPELIGNGGPNVGGNAGDDFERPIFHVEGGVGLFGAGAVDSIGFTILPRQ